MSDQPTNGRSGLFIFGIVIIAVIVLVHFYGGALLKSEFGKRAQAVYEEKTGPKVVTLGLVKLTFYKLPQCAVERHIGFMTHAPDWIYKNQIIRTMNKPDQDDIKDTARDGPCEGTVQKLDIAEVYFRYKKFGFVSEDEYYTEVFRTAEEMGSNWIVFTHIKRIEATDLDEDFKIMFPPKPEEVR